MLARPMISLLGMLGLFVVAGDLKVQADPENVVAARLVGEWVPESRLTERLTGDAGKVEGPLVFRSDPTITAQVPKEYLSFFEDHQVFLAGVMTRRGTEHPFLLLETHGNPHLLYFREKDGDPYGDSESFNLVIAPAGEPANDLLFVGGDFNNQPFVAFERQKR